MDHTTPPAERLQAAANLLRERAEECSSFGHARWRYDDTNAWPIVGHLRTDDGDPHGLIADIWPSAECGQYIALMHPAVALAVANVLDVVQRSVAYVQASDGTYPPMTAAAIAVADQILGIPAARALAESGERNAAGIEDYDSGAGWQRVADAMDRHGAEAVLTNPALVDDAPAAVTP